MYTASGEAAPSADERSTSTRRRALLHLAMASVAGVTTRALLSGNTAEAAPTSVQTEAKVTSTAALPTEIEYDADTAALLVENVAATGSSRRAIAAQVGATGIGNIPADDAVAIVGVSHAGNSPTGILGVANGQAIAAGVRGRSDIGVGVWGVGTDAEGWGVAGEAQGVDGYGVWGRALHASGVGIVAEHAASGVALSVLGKSSFTATADFAAGVSAASFAGNGSGLTGLNASAMTSGTVADARLSTNVPRKDATSTVFGGTVTAAEFEGGGAGLKALNASVVEKGTLPDARLSTNVVLKGASSTTLAGSLAAARFTGPTGKALSLAGSGTATIAKNKTSARVANPLCRTTSKVLATLQSSPGGASISHVKAGSGSFEVFLTASAKAGTKLAYLILA